MRGRCKKFAGKFQNNVENLVCRICDKISGWLHVAEKPTLGNRWRAVLAQYLPAKASIFDLQLRGKASLRLERP